MNTETQTRDIHQFLDNPPEQFPDSSTRWLFENKENVRGLIEIIANELAARIEFSQLVQLNRSFIPDTLRTQESDLLFRVPFQSKTRTEELRIYILMEHQSTVDPLMGFRVLFYMLLIWDAQRREWERDKVPQRERRLHPILPVLFYTGDRRWETPLTLEALMDMPEALARFVPRFDLLFLSVKETDAKTLTHTEHPLGWMLTVLQKERADKHALTEALLEAIAYLDALGLAQAAQRREAFMYLLFLILYRRPATEHQELITLVDRQTPHMEVETMAQSMAEVLLERGIAQGREQGIEQGIEQGREQGIERGIEQGLEQGLERGLEQGLEQGETQAKQTALLKLLQHRFEPLPQALITQIQAIQNTERLDALFEQVLDAETLDDIQWQNPNR